MGMKTQKDRCNKGIKAKKEKILLIIRRIYEQRLYIVED